MLEPSGLMAGLVVLTSLSTNVMITSCCAAEALVRKQSLLHLEHWPTKLNHEHVGCHDAATQNEETAYLLVNNTICKSKVLSKGMTEVCT